MPKILTGKPTNVLTPYTNSITSIANNGSGACRCTTSVPHLFGDGDTVLITGTTQANLDNLYWTIAVTGASTFDLVGSTFSATHTGTVEDVSLLPPVQCPLDGEAASMNTLLPVIQALLDRTQFLQAKAAQGSLRLVGTQTIAYSPGVGWGNVPTAYITTIGSSPGPVGQVLIKGATSGSDGQPPMSNVQAGDIVQVSASYTMHYGAVSLIHAQIRLEYQENSLLSGSSSPFDNGQQVVLFSSGTTPADVCVSINASRVVATPGPFYIMANGFVDVNSGSNSDWQIISGSLTYQVWRPNQ